MQRGWRWPARFLTGRLGLGPSWHEAVHAAHRDLSLEEADDHHPPHADLWPGGIQFRLQIRNLSSRTCSLQAARLSDWVMRGGWRKMDCRPKGAHPRMGGRSNPPGWMGAPPPDKFSTGLAVVGWQWFSPGQSV